MRRLSRRICALLAAPLVLATLGVPVPLVSAAPAMAPAAPDGGREHWITLVTGDRLLLHVAGGQEHLVTVRAGEGRGDVAFMQHSDRGDLYVLPADAVPLMAAGRLDRQLFNVSKLVEFGYDDRARPELPLIVTYQGGPAARSARSGLAAAGGEVALDLPSVDGEAVVVEKDATGGFWKAVTGALPQTLSSGLSHVWLDGPVTASLEESVPQVGAPKAWAAGHAGAGATVAVLDSGVDTDHPDLADAVVAAQDFTESETGTDDRYGHGTHVAGTITGSGAVSDGRYVGVAPGASLLNGKVLDDFGGGLESWIIAGMEWAVSQGADVVNMSLGGIPSQGTDPLELAVNELTREHGTLFVIAAGNLGPGGNTVSSPGAAEEALTVGAVDKQDVLAEFSSRGPRWGDLGLKPDITAPGVDIVAPLAADSFLGEVAPVVADRYLSLDGTSMATPHVAGAAAILAAQHPGWDAGELKPALMGSAAPRAGLSVHEQGAGRLDVARAVTQRVFATTSHVDNGIVRWPHEDDEPISRTITYRNDGPAAVTLDLTVDVCDPQGKPAPAGMFTLDRQRVVVPAGGTSTATLVTDTSVPAPDGGYAGVLTATGGQAVVRTPVGATREVESYEVTLRALDRDGQPTPHYLARFVDIDLDIPALFPYDPSGTVVVRVPAGRYFFESDVMTPEGVGHVLFEPELHVTGDTELVMDARNAEPVGFTVDRPDAEQGRGRVVAHRPTVWGETGSGYHVSDLDRIFVQPSTTTAPEFTFTVDADLAKPDGAGGFADSPYLYHVQWSDDERVPSDLVRPVRDRELITVQTRIAASLPDQIATKDWAVDLMTPATITVRYMPGEPYFPTVALRSADVADVFESDVFLNSEPVTYQRGWPVVERWNVGVFGPSFSDVEPSVTREGDAFGFSLHLFGDQGPDRWGSSRTDSLFVTLSRDGTQIGEWSGTEWGGLRVPAEPGTYRLAATATRSVSLFSTQVTTAWTFRSARNEEFRPLPVMAVRFAPDLDDRNREPSGVPYSIPVRVEPQAGSEVGQLRRLTVGVSYDDGLTWRSVPVRGTGQERTALVVHPRGAGFVSLRATVVDSNGNVVEQTIIDAYALKG